MAERMKKQRGKRVKQRYDKHRYGGQRNDNGRRQTERAEQVREGRRGSVWRLTISSMLIVSVIAWKLLLPQSFSEFRGKLMDLIGADQDFAAVFAAVGRVADGEGELWQVFNDAYVAVFGAEEGQQKEQQSATLTDLPADVMLQQEILGFAYQRPLEGTVIDPLGVRDHPIDESEAFHYGLDIAAEEGTVITSFADGKVTAVGESSSLGKYVVVTHGGNYQTLYAHCSRVTASSGQQVCLGDPIAEVGQTGKITGPHLHFELQRNTVYLNPIYYVTSS